MAEEFGIGEKELTLPTSLIDDLAVDSLDLLDLTLRIEEALDISLLDRLLADVRTYADLAALVLDRKRRPTTVIDQPVPVRARIMAPSLPGGAVVRVTMLTPYAAQLISDDARRTGQGTRIEITVPEGSRETVLALLRATFADFVAGGIEVDVEPDERWHT